MPSHKIVELFKLGEGSPPTLGVKTADVVDGFYSFLGFPRLVSSVVLKKGIAKGIQDGFFGYYSGSTPGLGSDGKYQVPVSRVRFNVPVTEDEIDLESGFVMMPQAVPLSQAAPSTDMGSTGVASGGGPPLILTPPPSVVPGASPPGGGRATEVCRDQLFR